MSLSLSDGTYTWVFQERMRDVNYVEFRAPLDASNTDAPLEMIEQPKLTFTAKRPAGGAPEGTNRNHRMLAHLELPVLKEAAAGAQNSAGYTPPLSIDHRLVVDMGITLPVQCTDADISWMLAIAKAVVTNTKVDGGVKARSLTEID